MIDRRLLKLVADLWKITPAKMQPHKQSRYAFLIFMLFLTPLTTHLLISLGMKIDVAVFFALCFSLGSVLVFLVFEVRFLSCWALLTGRLVHRTFREKLACIRMIRQGDIIIHFVLARPF